MVDICRTLETNKILQKLHYIGHIKRIYLRQAWTTIITRDLAQTEGSLDKKLHIKTYIIQ